MEKSAASKIISVLASIMLSILFVITAFALPIYYSVAGLLLPQTTTTIMQNIDYVEIFKNSPEINQIIKDYGIDPSTIDEVMKSEEAGALLEEFADELTAVITDVNLNLNNVDAPFMQRIVDKHIDNILPVIEEKNKTPIDKDKLKQEIAKVIESKSDVIKQVISKLEPVKQTVTTFDTVIKASQKILHWQYALIFGLIEALLLVIIYLMRKKNYGGFIWIAVNTGVVGMLISCVVLVVNSGLANILAENTGFLSSIIKSAISITSAKLVIALITCFAVMVLSVIVSIILRLIKRKSQ